MINGKKLPHKIGTLRPLSALINQNKGPNMARVVKPCSSPNLIINKNNKKICTYR